MPPALLLKCTVTTVGFMLWVMAVPAVIASHIAVEFLHPVTTGRPALPAYDLSMDKTFITALGNDVGFDSIFSRQLISLVQPGDVVIGVSTSGNSKNLIQAFRQAEKMQAVTIALTGGSGGEMTGMGLDHCLIVESDSIHRTQECHVAIYPCDLGPGSYASC